MNIHTCLEEMKEVYYKLIDYIEKPDNVMEENFQNLVKKIEEFKINENKHKFQALLYIIVNISTNHNSENNLFSKIEKILISYKKDILNFYSSIEIYHIFQNSKRLLLFLIQNNIIIVDKKVAYELFELSSEFFTPEIEPFKKSFKYNYGNRNNKILKPLPENFEEKRKIGENDDIVCEMIRKDLIDEFITYMNKTDISLSGQIKPSIYDTNSYPIISNHSNSYSIFSKRSNYPSLYEYAAYFGSIQIFKYLYKNGAKTNSPPWKYAIHGNHPEIISILEKDETTYSKDFIEDCINEAIKYHHNDVANYFIQNHYDSLSNNTDLSIFSKNALKFYNFSFIEENEISKNFMDLCKFDHVLFVNIILQQNGNIVDSISDMNTVFYLCLNPIQNKFFLQRHLQLIYSMKFLFRLLNDISTFYNQLYFKFIF